MGSSFKGIIPSLSSPSYILTDEWLFCLKLAGFQTELNSAQRLQLVYSNLVHKEGYPTMVN